MAITKVGVIVSKNRDLSDPLVFENRGGQIGENTVQLSGLDAATLYYTKGYFVQDGVTTEERQIHSFNTAAEVDYFWIENVYQEGYGIELRKSGTPNGTDIAYSFDKENWTPVNSIGSTSISIPYQSKVYFRSSTGWSRDSSNYWYFNSSVASWKVGGNISTLLNYNGDIDMRKLPYCFYQLFRRMTTVSDASELVIDLPTLGIYSCAEMFYGCTNLVSAPSINSIVIDDNVFSDMFKGCTSLTQAPAILPATTLANNCYLRMFIGCTALTQAPALPATTLATNCCMQMFSGCSSLTQAPSLPATTLGDYCYQRMFEDCTALTQAPATLPATTLTTYCYQQMFYGCTSLTQAPALPATTLAQGCYQQMFYGCSRIQESPELPATTLVSNCYYQMFYNCSQLSKITVRATSWNNSYANNWAYRVAASGNFYNLGEANNIPIDNASGVPVGWTVRTALAEDTPLTFKNTASGTNTISLNKIGTPSYNIALDYSTDGGTTWTGWSSANGDLSVNLASGETLMLKGDNVRIGGTSNTYRFGSTDDCTLYGNIMSLIDSTYSSITISSSYCFSHIFDSMTDLDIDDLVLPANDIEVGCYSSMFIGCTSLTKAPALPATTVKGACYQNMFKGCTSVVSAPALPATTIGGLSYYGMFEGCTSLVNAPSVLPATTLEDDCYSHMFYGCTSLVNAPAMNAASAARMCCNVMFSGCTSLVNAPSVLPATTLAQYCYAMMFYGCTSLVNAPALPATTMATACYNGMFSGCTSLVNAPELNATTLAEDCYDAMFSGCTSLNRVITHAIDISATNCLYHWLLNVSSTGDFYNLGSATYPSGDSGIPSGWTEHTSI